MRIALYMRVSTDEQIEKYGLDMQKSTLLSLIKPKGVLEDGSPTLELAGDEYIYIDAGVSGTQELNNRPAFRKLKEDILLAPKEQRPFDCIAVYRLDRLARRLKILLEVVDFFNDNSIQLISATEPIDTTNAFGRAMLSIIGTVAELEIEVMKDRTQGGKKSAKIKGIVMGSNPKFGYKKNARKEAVIFETEAGIVRDIFDMFTRQKMSQQEIARYLSNNGIRSPDASALFFKKREGTSKKKYSETFWRASSITKVLKDEYYIGKSYVNQVKNGKKLPKDEWELIECAHPQITDVVTFYKAQSILEKPVNPTNRDGNHLYLLSGLLKCDQCKEIDTAGKAHFINWNGSRKGLGNGSFSYYYKCGRKNSTKFPAECNTLPVSAGGLEDYVVRYIKEVLINPIAVYNHQLKLKSTEEELNHLQLKKKDLVKLIDSVPEVENRVKEQHKAGIIDIQELSKSILQIQQNKVKVQEELLKIDEQINQNILSRGYVQTLEMFKDQYAGILDDIFNNREEVYRILHILIEDITVFSREVADTDKHIVGRKKNTKQYIPYKLHIKLRLPQDILKNLVTSPVTFEQASSESDDAAVITPETEVLKEKNRKEFGVKKSQWWARRESNPYILADKRF